MFDKNSVVFFHKYLKIAIIMNSLNKNNEHVKATTFCDHNDYNILKIWQFCMLI